MWVWRLIAAAVLQSAVHAASMYPAEVFDGVEVVGENDNVKSEVQEDQRQAPIGTDGEPNALYHDLRKDSVSDTLEAEGDAKPSPFKKRMRRNHRRSSYLSGRYRTKTIRPDVSEDSFQKVKQIFSTAKISLSRVSRNVYAKGEDYWKEPRRRRALGYFALVVALLIGVAYGEHRENVLQVETDELGQRQSFVGRMEQAHEVEEQKVRRETQEVTAAGTAQNQREQELQTQEEGFKAKRIALIDKELSLREEEVDLLVRRAQSALISDPEAIYQPSGVDNERGAGALGRLETIKEEAKKLFWQVDVVKSGEDIAMRQLSQLEAEVRALHDTIVRAMALEEKTSAIEGQILTMQERLSELMTSFQIQLHDSLRVLSDDLWVARAEKELLKDPNAKERLLESLDSEWIGEQHHQRRVWSKKQAHIEGLVAIRQGIEGLKASLAGEAIAAHRTDASQSLFSMQSLQLQKEVRIRILDNEISTQLDYDAWIDRRRALVDEAVLRAQNRKKAWKTNDAARMELKGKIESLAQSMESLNERLDMCKKIDKKWRGGWGSNK